MDKAIIFMQVFFVFHKNLVVFGWFSVFIQQGAVKGIVNFKHRKMLKVFLHALYGKDFFFKGFFSDFMTPMGYAVFIAAWRVNLSDPPGIPVTCRADKNLRVKTPKLEFFRIEWL